MNIFGLGFIRGASDQYVKSKAADAEAERDQAKLDKELENKRKIAKMEAAQERKNLEYKLTEEGKAAEKLKKMEITAEKERDTAKIKAERDADIFKKQEEQNRVFGVMAMEGPKAGSVVPTTYVGQTRPLTFEEVNARIGVLQKESPTGGIALPATWQYTTPKGKTGDEFNPVMGSLSWNQNMGEGMAPTPRVLNLRRDDPKTYKNAEGVATGNFVGVVRQIASQPELVQQLMKEGPDGENMTQIRGALKQYVNSADFIKSLRSGPSANKDYLVVTNPFTSAGYGGSNFFRDPEQARWYEQNILKPLITGTEDEIRKMMGIPKEYNFEYDETNQMIVPNTKNWEWATSPDNMGNNQLDKTIHKDAVAVAKAAGKDDFDVLRVLGKSDKARSVLKKLPAKRQMIQSLLNRDENGRVNITTDLSTAITNELADANITNTRDQIEFVRLHLNGDKVEKPAKLRYGANELSTATASDEAYKKMYGITPADYQKKAMAAKRAADLATQAQGLIVDGYADATAVGRLIRVLGGAQDIATSLANLAGAFNLSDAESRARFQDNATQITQLVDAGGKVAGQNLLNLLRVQLGYQLASAYQGGGEGRSISDADVKMGLAAAGLDQRIGDTNIGAATNLESIANNMRKAEAVYSGYASTQSRADFEATYIYDNAYGGYAKDLTALIVKSTVPNGPTATPNQPVETKQAADGSTVEVMPDPFQK